MIAQKFLEEENKREYKKKANHYLQTPKVPDKLRKNSNRKYLQTVVMEMLQRHMFCPHCDWTIIAGKINSPRASLGVCSIEVYFYGV